MIWSAQSVMKSPNMISTIGRRPRNAIPFGFYPTDSLEGQRLLREHVADPDQVSILVLVDDKILVDPSNSEIAAKKPHWIDFNAGSLLDGEATLDSLADDLLALILDVASGRKLARNEEHDYREIAIWKEGVTL